MRITTLSRIRLTRSICRRYTTTTNNSPKPAGSKISLTKIVVYSTLVSGALYCDAALLASQNEKFRKVWVDNVPYGVQSAEIAGDLFEKAKKVKYEDIKKAAEDTQAKVTTVVGDLKETTTKTVQNVNSTITSVSDTVSKQYETAQKTIKDVSEGAQKIYSSAQTRLNETSEYVQGISSTVQNKYDELKTAVTGQPSQSKKPSEKKDDTIAVKEAPKVPMITKESKEPKPKDVKKDAPPKKSDDATPVPQESVTVISEAPKSEKITTDLQVAVVVDDITTSLPKSTPEPEVTSPIVEEKIEATTITEPVSKELHETQPDASPETKVDTPEEVSIIPEPVKLPPSPPAPRKPASELIAEEVADLQKAIKSLPDQLTARKIARAMSGLASTIVELNLPIDKVDRLKRDLEAVSYFIGSLEQEELEHLQSVLTKQSDKYAAFIKSAELEKSLALEKQAAELSNKSTEDLNQQKAELIEKYDLKLADAIAEQTQLLHLELAKAVAEESENLRKYWTQEVKIRVDKERSERLARLDKLALKLHYLESVSIEAGLALEHSNTVHDLWTAFSVLRNTVKGHHQKSLYNNVEVLKKVAKNDEVVQTVLSTFTPETLNSGIPTESQLKEKFKEIKPYIRRIQLMPDDGGVVSYMVSNTLSTVMLSKQGLVKGDDVESILARTEYFLKNDNIDQAARELNQLKGWPKQLARDWMVDARKHLEFAQAMQVIESRLILLRSRSLY